MDTTKLKTRMSSKVQELQQPSVAVTTSDTSLAPVDSTYIALTSNALDIIRANLKSQPLSLDLFDIVKSPSGGATSFEVPGLTGNEAAKELTGIVLDYTTPRAYWNSPDPVEGTPPNCMSQNSIISEDGKACAQCPFNTFGSKDGESNAKACKESPAIWSCGERSRRNLHLKAKRRISLWKTKRIPLAAAPSSQRASWNTSPVTVSTAKSSASGPPPAAP